MKHQPCLGVACTALLCLLATLPSTAQCTLACNDLVQVSLDQNGIAVISPGMVLEGEESTCLGPKTVEIFLPTGENIGDTVTCAYVNNVLDARVIDDGTGNFCWGTILIEDKLPPVITCQDTTVLCTADLSVDSIGYPAITDNCGNVPDTSYQDELNFQECNTPYTAILTRTWNAADASGNNAQPCVQNIFVVRPTLADVLFPLDFDNLAQPALSCSNPDTSVAVTGVPMVDSLPVGSLCKISVEYQDFVVEDCGNSFTVLREWWVLDCCSGEIITHTQLIKVEDIQPPVFDCPDTLVFSANGPGCAGIFMLPALPVSDDCSGNITVRTSTPKGTIEGNGGLVFGLPMGEYIVTYEAQDECNNVGYCEVVLLIVDDVAPVAICDEITQVSVGTDGTASVPASAFDDGSYDECCGVTFSIKRMDDSTALFLPDVVFDCDDIGDTTMVIVQVSDCRGNTNSCMVSVLTDDKLPPEITCPADLTLACTEWLPAPVSLTGEPYVQENCGVDTLYFSDQENLNICHTGTIIRTFTVEDISGFAAFCSHKITLIDTTPSQFFFPADTVVDCSVPLDSISAGEAIAVADCEAWALNISDEIFPIPCGLKIFRTYTFLDWCSGQDTSYTQFIKVLDTNPPVWDEPLGSRDTFYLCPGDLVKPPPPTATDFCTPVTVSLVMDSTDMECANRFVRTFVYSATDTCGNVAEPFVIVLTVNDTLTPSAKVPDMGPYNCLGEIPAFHPDSIDASDNGCPAELLVELISETMIDDMCMDTLIRTYRITDVCGLDTIVSQNFLLQDTLPPTADLPTLGPFPCIEFVPGPAPGDVVATDNCGGDVLVEFVGDSTNVVGCNGLVWYTYRLTDQCGNEALVTQILTVLDDVPPLLNCPDNVFVPLVTESCSVFIGISVDAADNCPGNAITITNDFSNGGATAEGIFNLGITPVTFFAEDACGNVDSCTVLVEVVELVPPTNNCEFIDLEINAAGQAIIDIDLLTAIGVIGGADFCTDVTLALDLDTLDCTDYAANFVDSLGIAIVPYTLTVTDTFGNESTCMNQIFLSDPLDICSDDGLVVGGLVFDENQVPMPETQTQLFDGSDMSYVMTSAEGWYHFADVPAGTSSELKPYKNDGLLNGVTTYDLIKISKHILGEELLGSPYKMIAADANRSGAVTTYDVVLIRKAILYVSDEFPNNTSWRFVPASHQFPDPVNPFAEPFPESAWINNINKDVYGKHFIGIKIGDVNNSASLDFGNGNEDRGGEELVLSANDVVLKKGETVEIPVFSETPISLEALQATVQFDAAKLAFNGMAGASLDITEKNYALPLSGSVTLSWDTPDGGLFIGESDVLFTLQFQILENTSLKEAIAINSTLTPAIAYSDGGNPLNVFWRTREVAHMPAGAANFFQLAQNRPNPFSQETRVSFFLKERMPVQLKIVDISGREIIVFNKSIGAGWHEVSLGDEYFSGSGIYFYQLITPYGSERRKMVLQ